MQKLFCVKDYKVHEDDPVINGHQTREMILEEAKAFSSADVAGLVTAIKRLAPLVANIYRINPIKDSAEEYMTTIKALNSDNVEDMLSVDRRFRSYTLEFDMFLDYWEAYIAHHRILMEDGSTCEDKTIVKEYKELFKSLTNSAYDEHVEYQLLDMIRNVTAHVQSPVNRIHIGNGGNEVYSDRIVLLSKCQNGENKKRILAEQDNEIALSPLVEVTAKCLSYIHDGLIDFQINESVINERNYIADFISYAASLGDLLFKPWIIMEQGIDSPKTYHIRDMRAYAYLLGRVRNER